MVSGQRANRHGKQLERFTAEELEDAGYEPVWPVYFIFALRDMDQPVYAEQVEVGRDIYGKNRRVDFLLFHPQKYPNGLVIQCKWQAVGGTVDQKYPFEVLCIAQGEYDTIIILDGGGYSDGAETWLKGQAGRNRLKHVFNQGDFQRFIARGNL